LSENEAKSPRDKQSKQSKHFTGQSQVQDLVDDVYVSGMEGKIELGPADAE
jgi:hypothetical protein